MNIALIILVAILVAQLSIRFINRGHSKWVSTSTHSMTRLRRNGRKETKTFGPLGQEHFNADDRFCLMAALIIFWIAGLIIYSFYQYL
jgi:beta-lactamase regulating signal transducer with metallopeptidase domain